MKIAPAIRRHEEGGTALMCAVFFITIISIVAAGVLMNCTARYNVTTKQVESWKAALTAAEGGADLAFAEVRKNGLDSTQGFATSGNWASPAPSPISGANPSWDLGYTNAGPTFGPNNGLSAKVTVDRFQMMSGSATYGYYRIRSLGTAAVNGFARTGLDDRVNTTTKGDSLVRKIDFRIDHFLSNYGYGDALASAAATGSNGKSFTAVSNPQISRRVELIVVPVMPIQAAVQTCGSFSFPLVDSYDSQYGDYPGTSTPATAPYNTASGQGNVVDGSSTFSGTVYGNVTTNGGNASSNNVSGVIDNNVPVTCPSNLPVPTHGAYESNPGSTITPTAKVMSSTNPYNYAQQTTFWYHYSSISGLDINPAPALYTTGLPSGGIIETNVNIVCDGDVSGITVEKGVIAKIYFSGNVSGKADTYDNNNVDGPQTLGVTANPVVIPGYRSMSDAATTSGSKTITSASANFAAADVGKQIIGAGIPASATISAVTNSTTATLSANATASATNVSIMIVTGYTASTNVSEASHFWMIGEGASQTISLGSGKPQTNYVVWYAPNADFSVNGNPDFVGAAVVKSFTGNGNNTFHYDLELATAGTATDYRVASYVEDIR